MEQIDRKRKDGAAYLALLFMVSIWGSNFLIAKYALAYFQPLTVASFRILIATIAFFFIWLYTRERVRIPFYDHVRIVILAFTGVFLNQVLFIIGLDRTTPAHAALMVATIPIFVFIFAGRFLKEGLLSVRGAGILISFAGVIILTRIWEFNFRSSHLIGDLIIMANSIAFAVYTILGKPILKKYKPINVTSIVYFYAVWMMLPFYPFYLTGIPYSTVPLQGYAALTFVVVFSTIVAYILFYWALARIEASKAAAIIYLQPLIGTSLSIIFGFEAFSMSLLIGGTLIIGGVVLTESV